LISSAFYADVLSILMIPAGVGEVCGVRKQSSRQVVQMHIGHKKRMYLFDIFAGNCVQAMWWLLLNTSHFNFWMVPVLHLLRARYDVLQGAEQQACQLNACLLDMLV
jgi:hypothetical protein